MLGSSLASKRLLLGAVAFVALCGACADGKADSNASGACEVVKTDAGQEQCIDNYLQAACDALPHKRAYSETSCRALGYTIECASLGSSPANGKPSLVYGKTEADCE